jgi:hypothetical protein
MVAPGLRGLKNRAPAARRHMHPQPNVAVEVTISGLLGLAIAATSQASMADLSIGVQLLTGHHTRSTH